MAAFECAVEEFDREWVFDFVLDEAFERAGAEEGIVALVSEVIEGFFGDGEFDFLGAEASGEERELDGGDLFDLGFFEAVEDDGLVDSVEEFGFEEFLEFGLDFEFESGFFTREFENVLAADIGGEDDDGVFEIYLASFGVGEVAFVEDLEEDVEDLGMGFFDFVKEDDAVWALADAFG